MSGGLALAILESLTILSARGVPRPSASDLAVLLAWLAVPCGAALWSAGLAAHLLLARTARVCSPRAAFTTVVAGLCVLVWLRGMVPLREAGSTRAVLELLLALSAAGAGAAVARFESALSGRFARAGAPPSSAVQVAWTLLFVIGLAWTAAAGYQFAGIFRAVEGAAPARPPAALEASLDATVPLDRPNVILISVDTLRADHLSSYGYGKRTSPNIDALARDGVRYSRATTTAAFTVPSHASMMTGLFPSSHGATYQHDDPSSFAIRGMNTDYATLAEILQGQAYDTAGFVSCSLVGRQFGFARGFSLYDDRFDRLQSVPEILLSRSVLYRVLERVGIFSPRDLDAERLAEELTPLAESWVRSRGVSANPFFLFVHYYDPHAAYNPPPPFNRAADGTELSPVYEGSMLLRGEYTLTPRALRDTLALYDGEISYVDRNVGNLLRTLKYTGSLDNAIVILTSDHGESFGEHDHWAHSRVLYEDVAHVPFIMRLPGRAFAGTVVDDVIAQPTDILPTVLSVAGLPPGQGVEGRDLTRFLAGQAGGGAASGGMAFAEQTRDLDSVRRFGKRYDRDLTTARTLRWKYIHASTGQEELFDLAEDAGETANLAARDPEALDSMRKLMTAWRASLSGPGGGKPGQIDEGTIEKLRSLGYVQ